MSAATHLPGRPTARVVEASSSHLRNGTAASNSGQDSVTQPGTLIRQRRTGRRALRRLQLQLSDRDYAILRTVKSLGLLNARQVERLHFHAAALSGSELTRARSCRRVLERLVRDGLLARPARRVGGLRAGSASFVYCLAPAGQRLLDPTGLRVRVREPGSAFVDHTLAVADAFIGVTEAGRVGRFEVLELVGEPGCWRPFISLGGGRQVLKPDLFVAVAIGDVENRWFFEIDLNTHHYPAIKKKAQQYVAYFNSGVEQTKEGVFPRVLFVAEEEDRVRGLRETLRGASKGADLFLVSKREELLATLEGGQP